MKEDKKTAAYPENRKATQARFHTGVHCLNSVLTSVDALRNQCSIEWFPYGVLIKGSNTHKFVYSSNIIDVTFERE
jgi:hypothetical protein